MKPLQATKFNLVQSQPSGKYFWSTPVGKNEGSPLMRGAVVEEWLEMIQQIHGPITIEYARDVAENGGASLFIFWREKEQ